MIANGQEGTKAGMIYKLLPLVAKEIGYVLKSKQMNGGEGGPRYQFRGVDDVMAKCSPIFIAHGICLSTDVRSHNVEAHHREDKNTGKLKSTYHASLVLVVRPTAEDGSFVEWVAAGEGVDTASGDKASYKATSGAYKYALVTGLCIPVAPNMLNDPDQARADQAARRAKSKPQSNPPPEGPALSPPALKAVNAIAGAHDDQTFARYVEAANKRIEGGEYTASEVTVIEAAIEKTAHRLSAAAAAAK